jgi:hypothetical protein
MCATIAEIMNGNWKFIFFSKFKRDLNLTCIFLWHIYTQFQPYTYIKTKLKRPETENFFKKDNSVKNHWTATKFKLDLRNPMMYLYIKFELNVCNPYKDNERKLKISVLFQSSIGITVKNQHTIKKFYLDLRIPMTNLHMQFEPYKCIQQNLESGNWKFQFLQSSGGITPSKINESYQTEIHVYFARGITLSKNHQTMTKFKLELHNPMMHPYTKFELNVCNCSRDNERKPFMEWRNDGVTEWRRATLYAPPFHGGGIKMAMFNFM